MGSEMCIRDRLCIKNVQIRDQSTGALLSMLAIGTAIPGGEDTPCRGRILLFAIMWERARDGGIRWRGELKCEKPSKMACSAIESVDGSLMVAIGTKLTAHSWDGKNLNPTAFYDTPYTRLRCAASRTSSCVATCINPSALFDGKTHKEKRPYRNSEKITKISIA